VTGEVAAEPVEADHRCLPKEVDQRIGDGHCGRPVGDRVNLDSGIDVGRLIGVQRDGKTCSVELGGNPSRGRGVTDDTDRMGDPGPQGRNQIGPDLRAFDRKVVAGPCQEAGRSRSIPDDDEHIH
jgi:hypothetical protein